MKKLLLALGVLAVAGSASAQDDMKQYLELLRQDLRTEKVAVVTEAMQLTDAQGEAFWPIYREYDLEATKLGDKRVALIEDYGKAYLEMDDAKAKDLLSRGMKLQEEHLKLQSKYVKKMEKEVGPAVAARFWQVDNQLRDLINLQIASNLPLLSNAPMGEAGDTMQAGHGTGSHEGHGH